MGQFGGGQKVIDHLLAQLYCFWELALSYNNLLAEPYMNKAIRILEATQTFNKRWLSEQYSQQQKTNQV